MSSFLGNLAKLLLIPCGNEFHRLIVHSVKNNFLVSGSYLLLLKTLREEGKRGFAFQFLGEIVYLAATLQIRTPN